MKSVIQLKQRRARIKVPVFFLVTCLGLSEIAYAVVPAPDGGYPGNNTAEGTSALFSLTSGIDNTALGFQALYHNRIGNSNSAEGFRALFSNITGFQNTASGAHALQNNTNGAQNTGDGVNALFHNTTGAQNTATGNGALFSNITGSSNTAVGLNALFANNADDNSALGSYALSANSDGIVNSAFGWQALALNTQGSGNTADGAQSLSRNVIGIGNTATGRGALSFSTGDFNTAIGYAAGINVATASNVICVGAEVAGADVNDSCFIGNIWAQPGGAQAVYVNVDGKLGAQVSSRRFKDNVKPMDKSSRALFSLKPVTFRYKKEIDPAGASQFGLVAEEVEKVNPDLVVRDKEGKPFSVRYDQVNTMLLNEFLKDHKKLEAQEMKNSQQQATIADLESTVTQQQKRMEALSEQLKEQATLIQNVSAQIEISRQTPKIVVNRP